MNALDMSGGPPPAPQPNPQTAQQGGAPGMPQSNALAGGMAAPQQQPQQQGQKPAPSHKQMVGTLLHLHAFQQMYKGLMSRPDFGKSSVKSPAIDGVANLVANRFISAAQGVTLLGDFPKEPPEQRKWIQSHLDRDRQAELVLLSHHGGSSESTDYNDIPPADQAEDHLDMMGGMHEMYKNQGGGNPPPPEMAIGAKQALRGFAEGGRPQPGQPAMVNEDGQEAFLGDSGNALMIGGGPQVFVPPESGTVIPHNALFMQSGMMPTPPYSPPMSRALPGYEDIEPNELAMMRHREMARPLAGRADFTPEHLATMATAAGGAALAPEYLLARAAMAAPRLAAGAAGAGALMSPSMAGETANDPRPIEPVIDPTQKEATELARVNGLITAKRRQLEQATKASKYRDPKKDPTVIGHQTSLDGLQSDLAKVEGSDSPLGMRRANAMGLHKDAVRRWEERQEKLAGRSVESELPYAVKYPDRQAWVQENMPKISGGTGAVMGLLGRGKFIKPLLGSAAIGGLEGAGTALWPLQQDTEFLPPGSNAWSQAANRLWSLDPDLWKRVGTGAMTHAELAAVGSGIASKVRQAAGQLGEGAGKFSAWMRRPGGETEATNALAAPPKQRPQFVRTEYDHSDGSGWRKHDYGGGKVQWFKDGRFSSAPGDINALSVRR